MINLEVTEEELEIIRDALEYYRTDVGEFGIRHGETPSEIQEAEMSVFATEKLMMKLGGRL
jgi:hypothetical protein